MQDITVFLRKNIIYFLIALLAYFAGDQKSVNQIFEKLQLPEITPQVFTSVPLPFLTRGEKVQTDKIYLIGKFEVIYVVDGDTIHVRPLLASPSQGEENSAKEDIVRLMAVNTLEKNSLIEQEKCFAYKQTDFTKQNLLNKEIYLYGDKTQPERDKYNRLLAYIATSTENFIDAGNNYFYNDYLIETGNAKVYRASPPAYKLKEFEKKEAIAKAKKMGMWGDKCVN